MTDSSETPRKIHPLEVDQAPLTQMQIASKPRGRRVFLAHTRRQPTLTYALIGLNILVFAIRLLSPELNYQAFIWGANSAERIWGDGQYWRLLTAMFLHASIYASREGGLVLGNLLHIVFNMYMLHQAGTFVEQMFGRRRFVAIYLLGGLSASLLSAAFGTEGSVGASGAVAATLAAEFMFFYRHRQLLGESGRQVRASLIQLAIFNLALGALSWLGGPLRIDNWGHLGGMLAGLVLAWLAGAQFIPTLRGPERRLLIARDHSQPSRYWRALGGYALAYTVAIAILTGVYRRL
jgi:rhomboid protease GluP